MPTMQELLAQMSGADPFGSNAPPYFTPGFYKVACSRAFMKDTRTAGLSFILNVNVLESNNPSHPIGSERGWFVGMNTADKLKLGLGNIKSFLLAVINRDYSAPGVKEAIDACAGQLLAGALSPINPLNGHVLFLECINRPKKNGDPFTVHNFFPGDVAMPVETLTAAAASQPAHVTPAWGGAPAPQYAPPPSPQWAPPPSPVSPDGRFAWNGSVWVSR